MAETLTPHYSWTKPDIGGDATTWGTVLNQTIDAVDSVVYANQQAILQSALPVGSVSMFAGATAPPNWLICDGSSLPTTGGTYDGLFAAIGYIYGGSGANFNLPNLAGRFPLGANTTNNPVGQTAGTFSYTLDVAHLPAHAHPITDVTHIHTAYQSGHSHNLIIGGHSHTFAEWVTNSSGVGVAVHADPASYWQTYQTANTSTVAIGGNTDWQQPPVGVDPGRTGLSTTQNAGGGAAMSIVPAYVALNFIIRFR